MRRHFRNSIAKRSYLPLLSLMLSCTSVPSSAQSDYARNTGSAVLGYEVGAETGWLSLKDVANTLSLVWTVRGDNSDVVQAVHFTVGGDIIHLGNRHFLVSGCSLDASAPHTLSQGYLLDVQLSDSPRTIQVVASQTYGAIDIVRMTYNASSQSVFFYDWNAKVVQFFLWTGTLPSGFVPVADTTQVPLLSHRSIKLMPSSAGVRIVNQYTSDETLPQSVDVQYVGSGWACSPNFETPPGSQWAFASNMPNANGPTIGVLGLAGATGSFALIDTTSATVASGTASGTGTVSLSIPRGALVPGGTYCVTGGSHGASPWLTVNSSWGASRNGANSSLLRGIVHDLYVGNQSFAVDMRNRWDGAPLSGPVSQDVYMAIGFNTQPSDNVVIDSDGTATIASVSTVIGPKATSIDPTSRQGAAVVEFPVPNDNGIAGLELLFQWIVWDGTTWLLSDVHGSLIFPAPTQTTAMRTSNQTPSAQSRSSGESWLNGMPGAMSTAARAALLQRVQASLRR